MNAIETQTVRSANCSVRWSNQREAIGREFWRRPLDGRFPDCSRWQNHGTQRRTGLRASSTACSVGSKSRERAPRLPRRGTVRFICGRDLGAVHQAVPGRDPEA